MLCNNCGKEIVDNAQFCRYCGAKTIKTTFGGTSDFDSGMGNNPSFSYVDDRNVEESTMLNIFGHKIRSRLIMKIAAIIIIACFILPMFTVSCAGIEVMSVSMGDIFSGLSDSDDTDYYGYYSALDEDVSDEDSGITGMIVYLVAPVIILILCRKKNNKMSCEVDAASIFIASALLLTIQYFYVQGMLTDEYEFIQITPLFAYYLYMAACAVGAFTGIKTGLKRTAACIEDEQMRKTTKKILLIKTILISMGVTFAMFAIFYLLNQPLE